MPDERLVIENGKIEGWYIKKPEAKRLRLLFLFCIQLIQQDMEGSFLFRKANALWCGKECGSNWRIQQRSFLKVQKLL